jgi:hypothetical protein
MHRQSFTVACLLLLIACPLATAQHPGPECCSTYPIYLCPPGYLGFPAPPRPLALYENCTGCNHGCSETAYSCGRITPNPYSCCFYGVTLSNYGLISPLRPASTTATPSRLPALPAVPAPEKLPEPTPR